MNCIGCEEAKDISIYVEIPVCLSCKRKLESERTGIVIEQWIKKTNSKHKNALLAYELLKQVNQSNSLNESLQEELDTRLSFFQKEINRLLENKKILQDHPSVRLEYLFKGSK